MDRTALRALVQAVRRGSGGGPQEAEDATLALGLLLEKSWSRRPDDPEGRHYREILGDEVGGHDLTEEEYRYVRDELLDHVGTSADPDPAVLWALGKSADAAIAPRLVGLVDQHLDDPARPALVYNALGALIPLADDESVRAAFSRAAARGTGEVRELAAGWSEHWRREEADDPGP